MTLTKLLHGGHFRGLLAGTAVLVLGLVRQPTKVAMSGDENSRTAETEASHGGWCGCV